MIEVGIRELKNNLSRYVRRVRDGEQIRVTMRGKPVADLVAAGSRDDDWRRELVASGRVTPAVRPAPKRAPRAARLDHSLSEKLLAEREDERR